MSQRDSSVLHVVGSDTPASRLEVLGTLCAQPALGRQRVVQFGGGSLDRAGLGGVERVRTPFGLGQLARRSLASMLAPGRQTVVHIWSGSALSWVLRTAGGGTGAEPSRAADSFRLLMDVELPFGSRGWAGLLPEFSSERVVRFVCPSAAARRRLRAMGVPPDACAIVRDSVDVAAIETADRGSLRRQLGISSGDAAVLILPPVCRETGALTAVWGAMLLEHARAGVRVIVPDIGREASRVVRLVESCRLGETLRAVGRRFTLPQLLAAADLAVYLPTGGAPLTGVIQAMAAGRPIVASDVPVIRELLAHGRTAWLCRPGDPKDACRRMLQALENHGQSSRQAKAARAHANAALGRRRMIAQYRRVYENLLADRPLAEGLAELGLVD
jgi:glycosyltransferase involved in cell wall biosynthesis